MKLSRQDKRESLAGFTGTNSSNLPGRSSSSLSRCDDLSLERWLLNQENLACLLSMCQGIVEMPYKQRRSSSQVLLCLYCRAATVLQHDVQNNNYCAVFIAKRRHSVIHSPLNTHTPGFLLSTFSYCKTARNHALKINNPTCVRKSIQNSPTSLLVNRSIEHKHLLKCLLRWPWELPKHPPPWSFKTEMRHWVSCYKAVHWPVS